MSYSFSSSLTVTIEVTLIHLNDLISAQVSQYLLHSDCQTLLCKFAAMLVSKQVDDKQIESQIFSYFEESVEASLMQGNLFSIPVNVRF